MKKILSLAAAGVLVLAACGDDDDGGDDSAEALVDAFVAAIERDPDAQGIELDEACLTEIAEGLPADDRAKIIDALNNDTDPEGLSAEGEAASVEIISCIDINFDEALEE